MMTRGKEVSQDLKDLTWKAQAQSFMGWSGEKLAPVKDAFGDAMDWLDDAWD